MITSIRVFCFVCVWSGAGGALRPSVVSASVGGRGRSGVDPTAGSEERERQQDVQGDQRGDAGAAAAQRQQEGGESDTCWPSASSSPPSATSSAILLW